MNRRLDVNPAGLDPRARDLLAAGAKAAVVLFAVLMWTMRVMVWIMSPLLGLFVSVGHGRRKRHRQTLSAIRALSDPHPRKWS